ncbi:hypothetical protein O6H91_02G071400 [Diphasiastrum complanatum]|uniref:Uncharacterized protein n=1 Tax=Diphasiastrum complanatum TaxID=34168 RepID=A0ACC2EGV1_DIPCM|nr:hypothetical protein O6H91_02G071400 [Diphasiastrum complanatum]
MLNNYYRGREENVEEENLPPTCGRISKLAWLLCKVVFSLNLIKLVTIILMGSIFFGPQSPKNILGIFIEKKSQIEIGMALFRKKPLFKSNLEICRRHTMEPIKRHKMRKTNMLLFL